MSHCFHLFRQFYVTHGHGASDRVAERSGRGAPDNVAVTPDRFVMQKGRLGVLQPKKVQAAAQTFCLLFLERLASDEIGVLFKRNRKRKSGLKRRIRRGHVVSKMPVSLLASQRVQRMVSGKFELECFSFADQQIGDWPGEFGWNIKFPSKLANVSDAERVAFAVPDLDS